MAGAPLSGRSSDYATARHSAANLPRIETVRVKPHDPAAISYQFRLGDGNVDLMKAFSLSSDRGIGASWKVPAAIAPAGNTFDERFGQW